MEIGILPWPNQAGNWSFISCKKSSSIHPQIMELLGLKWVNKKHLGLILYSKLPFEKHLNEKIIKANKNLGIIKNLSSFTTEGIISRSNV